jgi:hypothetical protein
MILLMKNWLMMHIIKGMPRDVHHKLRADDNESSVSGYKLPQLFGKSLHIFFGGIPRAHPAYF